MERDHINSLLESNPIEQVVSERVEIKKRGSALVGLSPFRKEKTPSFYIVPSKQFYKCFSSGKSGDVISFLMDFEGVSFMEAIALLEKRSGVYRDPEKASEDEKQRNRLDVANTALQKEFLRCADYSYFESRGFSKEIQQKWGVGYCDASVMKVPGIRNLMKIAGCLTKTYKCYFEGRATIPIHGAHGQTIAFSGRTLTDQQPKYINSSNHERFVKSDTLYGYAQAKSSATLKDEMWVVEGYTDVWAVSDKWTDAVCATMGTSLSFMHAKTISKHCDTVVLCGDGDGAGMRSMLSSIPEFLKHGMIVKIAQMPAGKDPAEVVLGGAEKPEPVPFTEWVRDLGSKMPLGEWVKTIKTMRDSLHDCEDEVVKAILMKQLQQIVL